MCVSFLRSDTSSWTFPTYIVGDILNYSWTQFALWSKVLWQIFVSVALLDHEQEPFFLFERSDCRNSFLLHFCLQIRITKYRDRLKVFLWASYPFYWQRKSSQLWEWCQEYIKQYFSKSKEPAKTCRAWDNSVFLL